MWKNFSEVFILEQFSSYFTSALAQKQKKNVTQVNPTPPSVLAEGLVNFRKPPDPTSPFNWTRKVEGGQLLNRSAHCVFWQLVNL